MIKEKIVQLIRSDKIFCPLGDHAVLRRQKLRADRRVKHIQQHACKRLIAAGVRVIAHQMTHQRLWDGGVDRVHGHMVAVVGRPAKRQLGQVAGPDHQSSALVREIHKDLRALACLTVFIGDVVLVGIVTDILKMHLHGIFNVDLL